MQYIARLLELPETSITAVSLHLEGSDLDPVVMSGSKGKEIDEQALEEYRLMRDDFSEKLKDARGAEDTAKVLTLERHIQAIENELRGAVDIRGEIRESTDKEAARTSVSRAIGVAIKSISKEHAELGRHLRESIRRGNGCIYKPDELIDWVL
ncbi:MAG: hypothetical protein ACX94C_06950 [Phycisphaerales bacterium]